MAHIYRILTIAFICFSSSVYSQGVQVGSIDLAGWAKNSSGTYSRVLGGDNTVTRNAPTNSTLSSTSTALVQTSKGATPFQITKTATIDVPRLGSAVSKFAQRVGPVGMVIGTATLICELTTICNDAGQWLMGADPEVSGYPQTLNTVGHYVVAGQTAFKYPTAETGCSRAASSDKFWGNGYTGSGSGTGAQACTVTKISDNSTFKSSIAFNNSTCPTNYTLSGSTCELTGGNPDSHAPSEADWDAKADLLNDDRFTPDLVSADEDIPTSGIPTLTPGQKKGLGLESKPTKDSEGNVTGREDTVTEIEAVDAGTTDNPGRVIIKETQTTIKYDINNNQISSTTNTSYSNQPQNNQNEPAQYTISFDEVPEAVLPTYAVPNTFEFESWGAGSCPPNVSVSLINTAFEIPTQPVCDMAEMVNPFVVLIASIVSIYIIAGVRGSAT